MQISSAMRGTEAATSVAEILAQFTIEPVDASHMPRDAIARNFKSLSAAVDAEMFAYPRRADESIEAYLQRMWFDQGSPQAVDRLITLQRLQRAAGMQMFAEAEAAEEARMVEALKKDEEAKRAAELRNKACPDRGHIDRLAACVARGAEAEAILMKLPELVLAHVEARAARDSLERIFRDMPRARAKFDEASLPPAPVRPEVALEPDALRERLALARAALIRVA